MLTIAVFVLINANYFSAGNLFSGIAGRLNIDSDRGSQYSSRAYKSMPAENGIASSMSEPGCPYDNSCVESFFATLKKELTFRRKYATIDDVKTDLYRYIELFYNRKLSAELRAVPHLGLYESRGIPSRKLAVSPSKRRRDFSVFRSATLHSKPKNRKKRRSIDVVSYDCGCFYAG